MKNEITSKAVASKAGSLLADIDVTIAELKRSQRCISDAILLLGKARRVAASALTQTKTKKGGSNG
jgi:hypothetical protein